MDMKDRIDNFLKVAEERMNNDVHDRELQSQLVDLCGELTELTKDPDEQNRLHDGFVKAQANARIAAWDERFLDVIAGEKFPEVRLDEYARLVSRGRSAGKTLTVPNQYMGQTYPTVTAPTSTTLTMGNTTLSEKELKEMKSMLSDRGAQCTTP